MPRPLVLAHRGARRRAPENTLAAFRMALELGADGVELDVHRTADHGLVVHHDAEARGLGLLAERSLEEVRAARPEIPWLSEVLDLCAGALVNIEIKNNPGDPGFDPDERAGELVVGLLDGRNGHDEIVVSSFSLATVDRVRAVDSRVPTGFLTTRSLNPFAALAACIEHGHSAIHPYVGPFVRAKLATLVTRAHDAGLRVNTWTVNRPAIIRRLAAIGVDGIMTDVPDIALRALGRPVGTRE